MQVLINLLSNACKFTHRGHIFVCVRAAAHDEDIQRVIMLRKIRRAAAAPAPSSAPSSVPSPEPSAIGTPNPLEPPLNPGAMNRGSQASLVSDDRDRMEGQRREGEGDAFVTGSPASHASTTPLSPPPHSPQPGGSLRNGRSAAEPNRQAREWALHSWGSTQEAAEAMGGAVGADVAQREPRNEVVWKPVTPKAGGQVGGEREREREMALGAHSGGQLRAQQPQQQQHQGTGQVKKETRRVRTVVSNQGDKNLDSQPGSGKGLQNATWGKNTTEGRGQRGRDNGAVDTASAGGGGRPGRGGTEGRESSGSAGERLCTLSGEEAMQTCNSWDTVTATRQQAGRRLFKEEGGKRYVRLVVSVEVRGGEWVA